MAPWMVWLAAAAVIWFPGIVLLTVLRRRARDRFAAIGESAALGIAFWPAALLLADSLHWRWNAVVVRGIVMAFALGCVVIAVRRCQRGFSRWGALDLTATGLAGLVLWTRVTHIRDVSLPLWVDSVHHTMIVRLLLDRGGLPETYDPFIAGGAFYYHWGFHAVAAAVAWLAGLQGGAAVAGMLLQLGQFLNVLVFFAVYAGARRLFRSRRTALTAAVLTTLVSFFPAYYVSWGRYTQLCGLLLLPIAAAFFWDLARHPRKSAAVALALVSAGLLLVHVRVATVFALVALVMTALLVVQRKGRGLAWCGAAAAGALLIASPWMVRLSTRPEVRTILAPRAEEKALWETSDLAPPDLLWAPNNVSLLIAASGGVAALTPLPGITILQRLAGIAWWLALIALLERSARRRHPRSRRFDLWRIGLIAVSVLLVALAANGHRVGLPRMRIVPNGAVVIMLFLPLALTAAHLIRWAIDAAFTTVRARSLLLLGTVCAIGVAGAWSMRTIINPVTVLATEADRSALAWIRAKTPPESRFVVGVQPWISQAYVGNDGGYWISVAADRASILPPGLYPWVMSREELARTTALLDRWFLAQQRGDPAIFDDLRRGGFTHVYVGPRNPSATRAMARESLRRVYAEDGVEIFALQ